MRNIKAYHAMCTIASQQHLPVRWGNDLYQIDRSTLTEGVDTPVCFGWILRENGTFLDVPQQYVEEREKHPGFSIGKWVQERHDAFSDCASFQYYWCNSAGVHRVSLEDYIAYLDHEIRCIS